MTVETQYGNHLGGGVVLYEGAFELDWDWMRNFCHETTLKEREGMYTPGIDPLTGKEGYINRSGYFFDTDSVESHPLRGSATHQNTSPEVIEVLNQIEEARDACLLKYLHLFPLVGKCIWWKIKSHLVAYPPGAYLGMHSDISTDYEYGRPEPVDQLATRNVVSVVAYLNDCVDTEEELDGTNFTDGHHYFEYLDIRHKPKKGDMLFFPSNYMAAHEVQPVGKGMLYTYLGWYCQGTPNSAVREAVVDPLENPDLAKTATNVYMTEGYRL